MMATVEIYTKTGCPYCARAKALLDGKGVEYRETEISGDPAAREVIDRVWCVRPGSSRTRISGRCRTP